MTGTPSRRQLHMDGGTTRRSDAVGAFLHEPIRGAARVCGEEAGSKALVRGTRSVYEAVRGGRGRVGVRSPKVIRILDRICDGYVERRSRALPREACLSVWDAGAEKRLRNSRKRSPGRSSGTTRHGANTVQRETRTKLGKPQGQRRADRRQQNPQVASARQRGRNTGN